MAAATCCFALTSCDRMSTRICVEHLLGVFGPRDQIVDVRAEERRKTIEESHAQRASRNVPISRRCDARATVMLS